LTAALEYVRAGDTVLVHSMDRLARNAEDLLRIVRELVGRGVSVEFGKNHLTFSGKDDPMAKLMLTMLATFGEFERELIRERQREGIAIAKAKGVYKGRKKALGPVEAHELVAQAHAGIPKADLARAYGISRETVYQYLRQNNQGGLPSYSVGNARTCERLQSPFESRASGRKPRKGTGHRGATQARRTWIRSTL
jgi:DNA invertase Pin-like site-specific DNA recombinase